MAITDNTFTPEELTAAVAANPALKDHLVGAVKTAGYVTRTADEETQFIGTKIRETYDGMDRDLFDTSGIAKQPTEKTYDYAKRVVSGLRTDLATHQQKIADLEQTIADGNGNETMKAQLAALQEKEADWTKQHDTLTSQLFGKDVREDVRDGLRGLKFNEALPEDLRKLATDNAEAQLVSLAKEQKNADGSTAIVYVRNGATLLNKDNQPASAADLLPDMLKSIVDAGQGGAGTGAGPQPGTPPVGGNRSRALPATLPVTVKTQGQLLDYLKEYGLAEGSKEFDEAYDKFSNGLPLR